jgi:hypothetical protein
MAAPVYFVARATLAEAVPRGMLCSQWLREVELLPIFCDRECITLRKASAFALPEGPSGEPGVLLCAWSQSAPERLGFYRDHQHWQAVTDTLWIGLDHDSPPTPDDLVRPEKLESSRVMLQGHGWDVPIYRYPTGCLQGMATRLPQTLYRSRGTVVRTVLPEYRAAWDRSAAMFDWLVSADPDTSLPWADVLDYCVEALGWNYRFDHNLQAVMQVFDSVTFQTIVQATVGWHVIEQHLEKKKGLTG